MYTFLLLIVHESQRQTFNYKPSPKNTLANLNVLDLLEISTFLNRLTK